jgi:hypothetical protein
LRLRKWLDMLVCMLCAGVFLLLLSKNSPLYPMNDWVDVQCFFTVGKGILNGIVPYRDLYEQKGPVLYFLFALAALIDSHSFIGVYLLETAAVGAFLYFSLELLRTFLGCSLWHYAALPVLAVGVCVSNAYTHGGSVETLTLWVLAYALLAVLRAVRKDRLLRWQESFLIGVGAAWALYIKFTMVGFHLGLCLFVAIWYLGFEKKPVELLKTIGHFLGGMAAVTAQVLAYFACHGAVEDFFTAYFYNKLFLYLTESTDRWAMIQSCLRSALQYNMAWSIWVILGLVWSLLRLLRRSRESLAVLLTFIGLTMGTYWGGRGYGYYALILAGFAPLGLVALAGLLRWDILQVSRRRSPWFLQLLGVALCVVVCLQVGYKEGNSTYLLGEKRENMPPYKFAEVINKVENPTLLNYGFLDGGFYYAADVLPTSRFFCTLNIPLEEMGQEHRQMIKEGKFDFVVTRRYPLMAYGVGTNYTEVDTATYYFEGVEFTYYLYQRTDLLE